MVVSVLYYLTYLGGFGAFGSEHLPHGHNPCIDIETPTTTSTTTMMPGHTHQDGRREDNIIEILDLLGCGLHLDEVTTHGEDGVNGARGEAPCEGDEGF